MRNKVIMIAGLAFVWFLGYLVGQSHTEQALAFRVGEKVLEQAEMMCVEHNMKSPGRGECIRNARAYFAQERYGVYSN